MISTITISALALAIAYSFIAAHSGWPAWVSVALLVVALAGEGLRQWLGYTQRKPVKDMPPLEEASLYAAHGMFEQAKGVLDRALFTDPRNEQLLSLLALVEVELKPSPVLNQSAGGAV